MPYYRPLLIPIPPITSLVIGGLANTDPSRISVSIRYKQIIYTSNISNVMVNINKYFDYQNIQSYNCYWIKCISLVLLLKYLNNNFF